MTGLLMWMQTQSADKMDIKLVGCLKHVDSLHQLYLQTECTWARTHVQVTKSCMHMMPTTPQCGHKYHH